MCIMHFKKVGFMDMRILIKGQKWSIEMSYAIKEKLVKFSSGRKYTMNKLEA